MNYLLDTFFSLPILTLVLPFYVRFTFFFSRYVPYIPTIWKIPFETHILYISVHLPSSNLFQYKYQIYYRTRVRKQRVNLLYSSTHGKQGKRKKNIKNLWQNIFILVKTMKTCRYIVDVRLLYLVQVRVARVESINLDCKIFLWPTTLKMSLPLWIFCVSSLFIYL